MAALSISLVIPAFNEAALLPRLLRSVEVARERHHAGREAVEVIVADNESTDQTAQIAADFGARVVTATIHRIGAVRNAGGRAANGDILCFIDADSEIHPETFNAIEDALQNTEVIGGATGLKPERLSVGIAATYAVLIPGVWATGFDAGVVFCRRSDFLAIGGYNEEMRFAEDLAFLASLKRRGRSNGQRLIRLRGVKALGSTRKFDEHGEWHYFPMMWRASLQYLGLSSAEAFADRYWYRPNR